jgi:hypothetical protein
MADEKPIGQDVLSSNTLIRGEDLSVLEIAKALQAKIRAYNGGGIKGVWEAIDPRFKYIEPDNPMGIKYPKTDRKISEWAFRKQVERLYKKKKGADEEDGAETIDTHSNRYQYSMNEKMKFGMNGNILLLMNVFEILEIKSISDLVNASFRKPDTKQYIIDTNIKIKRTLRKLNKIYDALQLSMERTPRFTVTKVCQDWEQFLYDIDRMLKQPNETGNGMANAIREFNMDLIFKNFISKYKNPAITFTLNIYKLLDKYHEYFSSNPLLYKYHKIILSRNTKNYNSKDSIFIISPIYVFYLTLLINKRFLFCIGSSSVKDDKERYGYINDLNFKNNDKAMKMLNGKSLGEYIVRKNTDMLNNVVSILESINSNHVQVTEDNFNDFHRLFIEAFRVIFEMNMNYTEINQERLDAIIMKIHSLDELSKVMLFGRAYFILPTVDQLERLNEIAQTLEKTTDSYSNEIERRMY